MSEIELVELFGVIAPTLRAAIKAIYKSETLCPVSTQRCDLATPKSWATFYNLEAVLILRLAQEWEHICAQPIITDVAYIMGNSLRVFYSQSSKSKQLYHIIWLHKRLVEQ